jgi:hypothetical protein
MNTQLGRGVTARKIMNDARVVLWSRMIGAVTWLEDREVGVFQYAPDFLHSGIQLAPLMMPLSECPYEFPALARNTFKGLPGLVADIPKDQLHKFFELNEPNSVLPLWKMFRLI